MGQKIFSLEGNSIACVKFSKSFDIDSHSKKNQKRLHRYLPIAFADTHGNDEGAYSL